MTAGWTAVLGFSTGLAGIAAGTVTAVLAQRSTTKRELMLAQRAWNEKLYVAQRDAIADLLLSCGDAYQLLLDNLGELIRVIGLNSVSNAQDIAAQSLIDKLENESVDNATIRRVSMERIEPVVLPDQVTESLREIIPHVHKRMVALDLLIANVELKRPLEVLTTSWSELAKSWYGTTAIARDWDKRKPSDGSMPSDILEATRKLSQWVTDFSAFSDAAHKYLQREIGT